LKNQKNCSVFGIDISTDALQICREKGIAVSYGDVQQNKIHERYDVIILSAILEHLIDPVAVLKKLKNNLKEKGCIIILVPNFSHLIARIKYLKGMNVKRFGFSKHERELGIQPASHINFFNKASLQYLLESLNYKIVQWKYRKSKAMFGLYQINSALFSDVIAVKAKIK
jgi:2-polyprenyl-3-methyl-5-hydroxy-6-metoxy-1,4-benzoquinol methylase